MSYSSLTIILKLGSEYQQLLNYLPMSFLRLDSLIKAAILDIMLTAFNISSLSR